MQSANILPNAFIVLAVFGLLQLLKSVAPAVGSWPNNLTRALGFALTYLMVVVNHRVAGTLHWPDLWGLLQVAGALYGSSALLYHFGQDALPGAFSAPLVYVPAPQGPEAAAAEGPPAVPPAGSSAGETP